jgi:uncharacterized protein
METRHHPLLLPSVGTRREIVSQHFGTPGARPKVVLQGSLHADELPGMLTLHHLRGLLQSAERRHLLLGEVVLVPVANPIGLDQTLLHTPLGRFDLASGENFNRNFPQLASKVAQAVRAQANVSMPPTLEQLRSALLEALAQLQPVNELESLRITLMHLAADADLVLDLHCDRQACVHLYTEPVCWPALAPLAAALGAQVVLLGNGEPGQCYDESLSGLWWQVARALGPDAQVPQACLSATVELRGQVDVTHAQASRDAAALMDVLTHRGVIKGPAPVLPAPLYTTPTPLAGVELIKAPHAGVLVYAREVGEHLAAGDAVADLVHPISGAVTTVCAQVAGCLFARHTARWAMPGMEIAKIAGAVAYRTGPLLGA